MDAHGGTLSVYSQGEGFGCTFSLQLMLSDPGCDVSTGETGEGNPVAERYKIFPTLVHGSSSSLHSKHPSNVVIKKLSVKQMNKRSSIRLGSVTDDGERATMYSPGGDMSRPAWTDPVEDAWEERGNRLPLPKALVVDDSPLNRTMLIRLLQSRCSSCAEAEDGSMAVQMIKHSMDQNIPYDVVLMDSCMPEMDGPLAARIIRDMGFKGLMLGVTGNALPEDIEHFICNGADAVLIKPLNVHQFDEILRNRNSSCRK